MSATVPITFRLLLVFSLAFSVVCLGAGEPGDDSKSKTPAADELPTLAKLKATGLLRSRFKDNPVRSDSVGDGGSINEQSTTRLARFESTIKPLLNQHCIDCHGVDSAEGNLRIDQLNPDLLSGKDSESWLRIFDAITKREMPPPDVGELDDATQQQLIDWLSAELKAASLEQQRTNKQSTFRRMTRYEYNYALQDLLGLPWDFAKDLPPEARSEDGFENRSDLLHLSVSQFETYHRIARNALYRATAVGDKPATRYWNISMRDAAQSQWEQQDKQISKLKSQFQGDPQKLATELQKAQDRFRVVPSGAYYKEPSSGRMAKAEWRYHAARYAIAPSDHAVNFHDNLDCVAVLPNGMGSRLILELGNQLPDEGIMRVTVRASRLSNESDYVPSLQLFFGWQASNEGRALIRVSDEDTPVTAEPGQPQTIQWDVPLGEIYPRNSVRKTSPMGALPSPSEYIRLVNGSASDSEVQIDSVSVAAPVFDQWPPKSHRRIFVESENLTNELVSARKIIAEFLARAWRRPIDEQEVKSKIDRFTTMRPQCDTFEETIIEVLAMALSSPQFLYVDRVASDGTNHHSADRQPLSQHALANRLSLFLWSSIPDEDLLRLADSGRLTDREVLSTQVERMLDDPRSGRFAKHFVDQWLDMQLLEYMNFKQHIGHFDPLLKEAMQHEPVALFAHVLKTDASVLDFIHCDYAMLNERLARHYGLQGVRGNQFRRVSLDGEYRRGGLLTQAGLLAMNSDWPDSHPLKRAIWLLESVLADPPPPPPPAVPQIDLADPEIAKMTLKERIEDHRNHAACLSCHIKIDPWGIAFENYDALGQWRYHIKGKPVDASSELFNHQTIDGMEGLKRFLLTHRQDQFVNAVVSKLAMYALGRPLRFADRAEIEAITARVRHQGDGLRTTVESIIQSDLFRFR